MDKRDVIRQPEVEPDLDEDEDDDEDLDEGLDAYDKTLADSFPASDPPEH